MTLFKKLRELVHHNDDIKLNLHDIQATVLRERPEPYFGTHAMIHFDTPEGGRELLRRLSPHIVSAEKWWDVQYAWIAAALSYEGLKKLGVPQGSLDSFPTAFKQGMAARAEHLFDVGPNDPKHWEKPFGTGQIHLALSIFAENEDNWKKALEIAERELTATRGVTLLMRDDFGAQPDSRNSLGYKDMISNPAIEGSGIKPFPGQGPAIKAGEFILGYPGEAGVPLAMPQPQALGQNGTFVALRKYHSNAGSFNRYLKANAAATGNDVVEINTNLYDYLIELDATQVGQIQPGLAANASNKLRVRRGAVLRVLRQGKGWVLTQWPEAEGGLVALDPANGDVRALVGGFDFHRNQFNHVTQGWRQPGSSYKPFIYAGAMERGVQPETLVNDAL